MEIDLTTPALLFSTISLLLLAFTNRFLGLAKTIRELHADYQENPEKRFVDQIKNLRQRVHLIRNMQLTGGGSLLLCTLSMLSVFAQQIQLAMFAFAMSLLLMAASLTLSIVEFGMSVGALNVHLADMEEALAQGDAASSNWMRVLKRLGRFSMTSMLWLAVVVALLVLWIRDHSQLRKLQSAPKVGQASWSISQILGPPNTQGQGDFTTAWASAMPDGGMEWVVVEFPKAVSVTNIEVQESFNPGAIVKISAVSATGSESVVWDASKDTISTSVKTGASFCVKLKESVNSRRFKIELDSASVRGWNELDAVAIIDESGNEQWASDAWASSSFGANNPAPSWYWP